MRLADQWLDETTVLTSGVVTTAAWSRAEWIESTAPVWRGLVEPVAGSIVSGMGNSLPEEAKAMAGPLMGMLGQAGGAMFGAQVGSALGELSSDVLTASDIGLPLGPEGKAALLTDNVATFAKGLTGLSYDDVLLYLALREAAHHRLFAQVPWLRRHLLASVEEFGQGITFDISGIDDAMRNLNPAIQPRSSRRWRAISSAPKQSPRPGSCPGQQLETTLALVEGWVDEVVGLATETRMPDAVRLKKQSGAGAPLAAQQRRPSLRWSASSCVPSPARRLHAVGITAQPTRHCRARRRVGPSRSSCRPPQTSTTPWGSVKISRSRQSSATKSSTPP
ncbi:MAG: zinc-dependent metalloprotease [Nocardioidaceae bacterium]